MSAVTSSVVETLRIEQVGGDKFGNYSCVANNSISSASSRLMYSGKHNPTYCYRVNLSSEKCFMRQFSINTQNLSSGGKDKQKFTRNLRKRNALLIQFLLELS